MKWDDGIDTELEGLDDEKPAAPPKPPAGKAAAPVKPKAPAKEEESDPGKVDPPEGGGEAPVKPVKAADLRGAYEGLKKKVREEYEPELNKLRDKVKEYEASHPQQTEQLTKELEETRKRRDELESEIRFVNYQKSTEYQEKYVKPYQEAWNKAVEELAELTVSDAEGNTRTATANDLLALANLPLGEARRQAREMFGDAADDVMTHRRVIRELSAAQTKALDDAQKQSGEREKQLATQRQIEHQQTIKLWQTENQELAKKYPNWFAHVEGDTEGNALLDKGMALADLHFVGAKDLAKEQIEMLPPAFRDILKTKGTLSVQERVKLDALLRHKIASHSRIAHKLKTAHARIKELEKSLAEYEQSSPPAGKAGGGSGKGGETNPVSEAEAELDAIDRKYR